MSFIDTALQMLVLAIPMAIGFLANRLALMGRIRRKALAFGD